LAEISTRQIAERMKASGMLENKAAGKKGGGIARKARQDLGEKTGKSVVTGENFFAARNR
jgi:DNA invertase Pin-like site-specific DNA recombinase